MQQYLQQRVFRVMSLQQHFALLTGAAGAASHLNIELGKTFGGAKVSGEQRAVHIQQRHQRHIRKMMALRQHLRADQNTRAAAKHVGQMLLQRAFAAGGVAVDARQRHAGKQRLQIMLQLLGA